MDLKVNYMSHLNKLRHTRLLTILFMKKNIKYSKILKKCNEIKEINLRRKKQHNKNKIIFRKCQTHMRFK